MKQMTDPFYCIPLYKNIPRVYYLTNPLLFWFVNTLKHDICYTFFWGHRLLSDHCFICFVYKCSDLYTLFDASHQIQGDLHSFHLPRHISGCGNSFQDCCEGHSRKSNRNLTLSSLASMKPLRSVSYFRQACIQTTIQKRYCNCTIIILYVQYILGLTNQRYRSACKCGSGEIIGELFLQYIN